MGLSLVFLRVAIACLTLSFAQAGNVSAACIEGSGEFSRGGEPPLGIVVSDGLVRSTADFQVLIAGNAQDSEPDGNTGIFLASPADSLTVTICKQIEEPLGDAKCTVYESSDFVIAGRNTQLGADFELRGNITDAFRFVAALRPSRPPTP